MNIFKNHNGLLRLQNIMFVILMQSIFKDGIFIFPFFGILVLQIIRSSNITQKMAALDLDFAKLYIFRGKKILLK